MEGAFTARRLIAPALAVVLSIGSIARAEPLRVSIRAESELSISAYRDGDSTTIEARLNDDLGSPMEGAQLHLGVDGDPAGCFAIAPLATDRDGLARWSVGAACTPRSVRVEYEGDRLRQRVARTASVAPIPPTGQLSIAVRGGTTLDLDAPSHALDVAASDGPRAASLHVVVTDELSRPIADGVLDGDGRAEIVLPSARLGGPGAGRLVATIDADGARRRSDVAVLKTRRSHLTLARLTDDDATIAVEGRLFDANGGLAGETIAIELDGRPVGATETAADGRFRFRFRGDLPARSRGDVVARYESRHPGRSDSVSRALRIVRRDRIARRALVALAPLLAALVAFAIARHRSRVIGDAPIDDRGPPVRLAKRRFGLRASRRDLVIRVEQRRNGHAVAGARITLSRQGTDVFRAATDERGGARVRAIADGAYHVEVACEGFATRTFEATFPHGGELDDVRVELVSLRERALDVFEPVGIEVLGRRQAANATIREVAVRGVVEGLASDVPREAEEIAYGAPAPEVERVDSLERRVREFLTQRSTR